MKTCSCSALTISNSLNSKLLKRSILPVGRHPYGDVSTRSVYIYIPICVYVRGYTYKCIHTYIHAYRYTSPTYTYTNTYIHIHTNAYINIYTHSLLWTLTFHLYWEWYATIGAAWFGAHARNGGGAFFRIIFPVCVSASGGGGSRSGESGFDISYVCVWLYIYNQHILYVFCRCICVYVKSIYI